MSCLYILEINPGSVVSFAIIFSHSEDCPFTLLIVSFAVKMLLSLIRLNVTCLHLFLNFLYNGRWVIEDLVVIYVIKCSMFSTKSFIVSCLTFRFLIHFEFIFVYGVRKCSNFILEHVAILSSFPTPFIEEAVFAPLYILVSFVKNKIAVGALVYFCAFYLVPLVYISVFMPVPYCLPDYSIVV